VTDGRTVLGDPFRVHNGLWCRGGRAGRDRSRYTQKATAVHLASDIAAPTHRTATRDIAVHAGSDHNIIALDGFTTPLLTQRILIVGTDSRPFAATVGAGIGNAEPVTPPRDNHSRKSTVDCLARNRP
jgi:hypothetical protein